MISVCLCTHQPSPGIIGRCLAALRAQAPPGPEVELIVVDNASDPALDRRMLGLDQCPFPSRLVQEKQLGLGHARMRALREARGSVIVLVDDDNFLHTSYLKAAWKRFSADPGIGVAGGIVRPEFDGPPPAWFKLVARSLSVNDWGKPEQEQWTPPNDPPPGTGLALRAEAFRRAAQCSLALHDRRGLVLTSGGDTEIVLRIQLLGWKVDYEPGMQMSHFLPCRRFEPAYLVGLKEGFGAASCIIDLYDAFRPTLPSIYYARRARHHWQEKRRLTRSARAAVEESLRIKDTLEAAYHRGRARGYARLAWSQRDRRLVDRFLERAGVGHGV